MRHLAKIIVFLLIGFNQLAYSQDVHFSQRLAADKQRNAAFTAQFEGNWQAFTVYRQQWQSIGVPFTTSSIFLTKRFYSKILPLQFYGGLIYTNDQSGDAKLTANDITLNLGASLKRGRDAFNFFISNTYSNKSFNQNGLTFPSQYDRSIGGFNENLGSGEFFQAESTSYYDLGVGGLWKRELNDKWRITSGASVLHLLEPEETFFNSGGQKNMGYGLQFEADHDLSQFLNLFPYVSFYRAKGASETIIGSSFLFNTAVFGPIDNIKPFLFVRTGIDRLSDAIIFGTNATIGSFQLGASYDFNISELEIASNYQGGFELTLAYTHKGPQHKRRRIPCERY